MSRRPIPVSMGRKPDTAAPSDMFIGTDVSNAEKFVEVEGTRTRYCYETGRWLLYNDLGMWASDNGELVLERAEHVGKSYAPRRSREVTQ